ncbi:MAG TPA: alpha/beta fold hydrolase [Methylomirabilota bacterium]|nr:alpha/beta fold hydrolase [Methylomirabilota bacterium]
MRTIVGIFLLTCLQAPVAGAPAGAALQTMSELRRLLPRSEPWETWLRHTGELPPDFAALPSRPLPPDPIRFADGSPVTVASWPRRRHEMLALFQSYVTGAWPASPGPVRVVEETTHRDAGAETRQLVLAFGPGQRARLTVELIMPPGPGPFPVFLTQHNHRSWALVAVSRGYLGCVYAGADSRDDTADWPAVWPAVDWTKLTRRAWAASRCIDHLQTVPEADTNRIALAGHSRNGKTALIAAAFDPRISAVISSSSGAGGACSYRGFSEAEFGEGIELITRTFPDWLHPRLRFFTGRENKLPVDQPQLVACIAPRACLISSALNDPVESIWDIERTRRLAQRAFDLLGHGHHLQVRLRPGGHETRAGDIEAYLDWLDTVFGRGHFPSPDVAICPTYEQWRRLADEAIDVASFPEGGLGDLLATPSGKPIQTPAMWAQKREAIRDRILWGLGEPPPFAASAPGDYGAEALHRATLLGRAGPPPDLVKRSLNFGNYIAGDLYFPAQATNGGVKLPAVIWLHPSSSSHGYTAGYRRGDHPHVTLARQGFAVFAFDQIGHGSRLEEASAFFLRYPRWSLLGKQVEDTLAAVEALQHLDLVDTNRVYLVGYGMGGRVALHAGALDERVAGVVSVAGFTPMRGDTEAAGTGGIARWAVDMPLQPRLGAFIGQEKRIPYDFHEVLALLAPRPVLVVAPRLDWHATPTDVRACVEDAGRVYERFNARAALQLYEPDDYNRFSPELQQMVGERLRLLASR